MAFVSYRLFRANRIVRIGKGTVSEGTPEAIEQYLRARGYSHFTGFDYQVHSSESAAFKEEKRLIESYERKTGRLPPRNERAGGGGGRVGARCKSALQDGSPCMNSALPGNYGFCGVHR